MLFVNKSRVMAGTGSSNDEVDKAIEKEKGAADANINIKRKRYLMVDEEDVVLVVKKKCNILSDRFTVASTFGLNSDIGTSTWFKYRGTRIISTEVEIGALIAVPVDVPDADEEPDENWALSSNWYICHVVDKKDTTTAQIKLLG